MKKTAIIILNYKGASDTIACLDSLRSVNGEDFEIFLVDNGSSDDSVPRLLRYIDDSSLKIHLVISPENVGFSAGNNLGIHAAKSISPDYFLFLNNDTIVQKDFLTHLRIALDRSPRIGFSVPLILFDEEPKRIWYAGGRIVFPFFRKVHLYYRKLLDSVPEQNTCTINYATGCCLFCSRQCLETVGIWDENFFLYSEDVEFSLRVIQAGFEILYEPHAVVFHKVSASAQRTNLLSDTYSMRNRLYVIDLYCTGWRRGIAHLYNLLQILCRVLKRDLSLMAVIRGIHLYRKHEMGRIQ